MNVGCRPSARQRTLALLEGEMPDRVPWLGDLSYWAHALEVRGEVPPGGLRARVARVAEWVEKVGAYRA